MSEVAKKRKVGTVLETQLLKRLKLQAVEEGRPMADIIADAIALYLETQSAAERAPVEPEKLLKHPALKASYSDVRAVLDEDTYQL